MVILLSFHPFLAVRQRTFDWKEEGKVARRVNKPVATGRSEELKLELGMTNTLMGGFKFIFKMQMMIRNRSIVKAVQVLSQHHH